jgi:hypothetical protein
MSMNPILNNAIFQLAEAGIRKPKVWKGGKHYRISWEHHGEYRTLTVPLSPGDYRSQKNNAAQLKRILRADGLLKKGAPVKEVGSVLDKPVTINNGVSFAPPELVKRVEALEKDMVAMLDLILEARDKPAPAPVKKVIRSQLWELRQARRRMNRLA